MLASSVTAKRIAILLVASLLAFAPTPTLAQTEEAADFDGDGFSNEEELAGTDVNAWSNPFYARSTPDDPNTPEDENGVGFLADWDADRNRNEGEVGKSDPFQKCSTPSNPDGCENPSPVPFFSPLLPCYNMSIPQCADPQTHCDEYELGDCPPPTPEPVMCEDPNTIGAQGTCFNWTALLGQCVDILSAVNDFPPGSFDACNETLDSVFGNEAIPVHVQQDIHLLRAAISNPQSALDEEEAARDLSCLFTPGRRVTFGDSIEFECQSVGHLLSESRAAPMGPSTQACRNRIPVNATEGDPVWYTVYVDQRYVDEYGYEDIPTVTDYVARKLDWGIDTTKSDPKRWDFQAAHNRQPDIPMCVAWLNVVPPSVIDCNGQERILGGMVQVPDDLHALRCHEERYYNLTGDRTQAGQFVAVFGWTKLKMDDGKLVNGVALGDMVDGQANFTRAIAFFQPWYSWLQATQWLAYHEISHIFTTLDGTTCDETPHKWYHIMGISSGADGSCSGWYYKHFHPWLEAVDTDAANAAYAFWHSSDEAFP